MNMKPNELIEKRIDLHVFCITLLIIQFLVIIGYLLFADTIGKISGLFIFISTVITIALVLLLETFVGDLDCRIEVETKKERQKEEILNKFGLKEDNEVEITFKKLNQEFLSNFFAHYTSDKAIDIVVKDGNGRPLGRLVNINDLNYFIDNFKPVD